MKGTACTEKSRVFLLLTCRLPDFGIENANPSPAGEGSQTLASALCLLPLKICANLWLIILFSFVIFVLLVAKVFFGVG